MWIRLLLANLSKGANNGNEVISLLFILMMMLFEKGFPYFNPHAVIQVAEQFLLVQDQVWKIGAYLNPLTDRPQTPRGERQVGYEARVKQ